jgi:hypothetical protein
LLENNKLCLSISRPSKHVTESIVAVLTNTSRAKKKHFNEQHYKTCHLMTRIKTTSINGSKLMTPSSQRLGVIVFLFGCSTQRTGTANNKAIRLIHNLSLICRITKITNCQKQIMFGFIFLPSSNDNPWNLRRTSSFEDHLPWTLHCMGRMSTNLPL